MEKAPDMEAWEEAVLQASLAAGATALGAVLSTLGGGRRKEPLVCSCGARMHSAGLRSKRVTTVLGEVVFSRSLFICPACGNAPFPADQALDMEHTGFSPGVRRLMARAGASRSFGQAEEDLRLYAHIDVDPRDIERVAEALGRQIEDLQARQPAAPLGEIPPIPVLYVEYDGTAAPMRKGELAGRRGRQPGADPKGREVKLGCVFTQSGCDEEGYAVRDEDSTTYVAGIESSSFFGERIYNEALRRGIEQAVRVVVLTDGAAYNRTIKDVHFSGALHIVDLYHAGEHLTALMDLLRIAPSDRKKWLDWLDEGRIDALAAEAERNLPSRGKRRKEAKREINFFVKNKARMQYAEFRRQGLFVGSGVIEAGCKTAVGTRCKQSGMFWSVRGAHAILQLRCCILSGRFDAAWEDLACDRRVQCKVPAA